MPMWWQREKEIEGGGGRERERERNKKKWVLSISSRIFFFTYFPSLFSFFQDKNISDRSKKNILCHMVPSTYYLLSSSSFFFFFIFFFIKIDLIIISLQSKYRFAWVCWIAILFYSSKMFWRKEERIFRCSRFSFPPTAASRLSRISSF